MIERLPAFYYQLPVDQQAVTESIFRLIETSATDHSYWFIEDGSQYAGTVDPIWREAVAWCEEQFGLSGESWNYLLSSMRHCYVTFATQDDAFAFRMRWC